jgi:elongation factor P--(R)-beta-lysine ligase
MDAYALTVRHEVLKAIRAFFYGNGFLEVETAHLIRYPAPDAHVEPLRVFVAGKGPFFLHTSPEIGMKKLLAEGQEKIFQICKVFRVEELEEVHSTEFTMLEWYMPGTYREAMTYTERLVTSLVENLRVPDQTYFKGPWKQYSLAELCLERTGINPAILDRQSLFETMRDRQIFDVQSRESWDDLFFKLFIQEVEPHISAEAPFFIQDWPVNLSSMAKRKDAHTVERFELYMRGLEIANGYSELFDPEEQRARFLQENDKRCRLGKEPLPVDMEFLADLSRVHESFAGVSVGVDRLLMALLGKKTINEVLHGRFLNARPSIRAVPT